MISTWLSNGKVKFAVVQAESKELLVCTSDVGAHRVIFVEDVLTGKRVLPTLNQHIATDKDMDEIVLDLAKQL